MSRASYTRAFHRKHRAGETFDMVTLKCGHTTKAEPVVIQPSKRKLYRCPEGCGLMPRTHKKIER